MMPTTSNAATSALGAWDNGSQRRLSGRAWQSIAWGDGFNASIDAAGDGTIYHDIQAADDNEFARYPDGADLGGADGWFSNPYRPGEMLGVGTYVLPNHQGDGKLYGAENVNTAGKASWICADPTGGSPSSSWGL